MDRVISMADLSPLLEEVLRSGRQVELTATGCSMRPMLWGGVSKVRLTVPEKLRRGDVILYKRSSGTYVLHRITAMTGTGYVCCGDAQTMLEPGVMPEQVLAAMQAFTWRGRWVKCSDRRYQMYWRVWLALRPARRVLMGIRRRLRRAVGRGRSR